LYTFKIEKNTELLGFTLRADVEKITVGQPWIERSVKLFLDNRGVQKKGYTDQERYIKRWEMGILNMYNQI